MTNWLNEIGNVFWPIKWHENKKFVPLALMMVCILFNYSTVRSVKDGLCVSHIGAEAVGFLKTQVVLPSAMVFMVIQTKLCNLLTQTQVFQVVTLVFITYFSVFTFVLQPAPGFFHMSKDTVDQLVLDQPNFKWFIRIAGSWSQATFQVMAEMQGSMVVTLLFWQFANQITKPDEAKRFYSHFGLLGNIALPVVALVFWIFLSKDSNFVPEHIKMMPVLIVVIVMDCLMLCIYTWIQANVLTDPALYDAGAAASKKGGKAKLGLGDSFKLIFGSKQLGYICMLVLAYGISINLVEGVWKSKIKQAQPDPESYTLYMGTFQANQGFAAIVFMLVGSNILRNVSWTTAALFTPVMIFVTGILFFTFIVFTDSIGAWAAAAFATSSLSMAVLVGMIQNVLSKATKYSLFDSTKEMSQIPLDDELKSKGKAAVDVVGGRFGKAGGGVIQSTVFLLLPSFTQDEATPFFAVLFFITVLCWIFAARGLGVEQAAKLKEREVEKDQETKANLVITDKGNTVKSNN